MIVSSSSVWSQVRIKDGDRDPMATDINEIDSPRSCHSNHLYPQLITRPLASTSPYLILDNRTRTDFGVRSLFIGALSTAGAIKRSQNKVVL